MRRHDGKPDLPEPWKSVVWALGALTARVRGATVAMNDFAKAWRQDDENVEENDGRRPAP